MNPDHASMPDPARCPLCGRANNCQLCTANVYKGPCWCAKAQIPEALLFQVPLELRNRSCICEKCVAAFHRASNAAAARQEKLLPGDFYFDLGGLMVFTSAYHLRRGYCCNSGCRHCPYRSTGQKGSLDDGLPATDHLPVGGSS